MGNQVFLVGAEDVAHAGRQMASAAEANEHAAMEMSHALDRHATRTEQLLSAGLPAEQLELLGLVALLNFETALINAEIAFNGARGIATPSPATARRLSELIAKVRGA